MFHLIRSIAMILKGTIIILLTVYSIGYAIRHWRQIKQLTECSSNAQRSKERIHAHWHDIIGCAILLAYAILLGFATDADLTLRSTSVTAWFIRALKLGGVAIALFFIYGAATAAFGAYRCMKDAKRGSGIYDTVLFALKAICAVLLIHWYF